MHRGSAPPETPRPSPRDPARGEGPKGPVRTAWRHRMQTPLQGRHLGRAGHAEARRNSRESLSWARALRADRACRRARPGVEDTRARERRLDWFRCRARNPARANFALLRPRSDTARARSSARDSRPGQGCLGHRWSSRPVHRWTRRLRATARRGIRFVRRSSARWRPTDRDRFDESFVPRDSVQLDRYAIVAPMRDRRCPICKKPVAERTRSFPFCSARCKLVDAGNWMQGVYRIESERTEGPWGES